jgi:hypothetical protein
MKYNKQEITPLLESIVLDNPTYNFPIATIQVEITNMFVHQEEFDYFLMMAYRKLKREHNQIIANIFITTCELILDLRNIDVYQLPPETFYEKIEVLYDTLNTLKITRISKETPDGVLMTAMQ